MHMLPEVEASMWRCHGVVVRRALGSHTVKMQALPLLAVGSVVPSKLLNLSFSICKMGRITMVPPLWNYCEG